MFWEATKIGTLEPERDPQPVGGGQRKHRAETLLLLKTGTVPFEAGVLLCWYDRIFKVMHQNYKGTVPSSHFIQEETGPDRGGA